MPRRSLTALLWAIPAGAILCAFGASHVAAQFAPPSTILGSVADSAGEVPAGLKVEAYIGDKLCSVSRDGAQKGFTQFAGEGSSKVTMFVVDALSKEDREGCGSDGAEVRIKIGDRFAPQTTKWHAGLVNMTVTFGDAKPAVIPTFTPAPATPTSTPRPTRAPEQLTAIAATAVSQQTSIAQGTPASSFSPIATLSRETPAGTIAGGLVQNTPASASSSSKDDGGGFPTWGFAVIGLGVLAVAGGLIGLTMARRGRITRDDD